MTDPTIPPVEAELIAFLARTYPPKAVPWKLGDDPGQYALACAHAAGQQDIILRLQHIHKRLQTDPSTR